MPSELNVIMMKYDAALYCYLLIGSHFPDEPLHVVEKHAVDIVNQGSLFAVELLSSRLGLLGESLTLSRCFLCF
jgi:hypothetical protein